MKLALYKGSNRCISKLIKWWTKSDYSHCEIVFSDGMWGSSSDLEGGVCLRYVEHDPQLWVFYDISHFNETRARAWFELNKGRGYDYLGLLGFVIRPIKGSLGRLGCGHACMAALGYKEPWRFDPGMLAVIFGPKEH